MAKESDASEQLSELLTFSNKPAVSQELQQASQVALVVNNRPANAVDARDAGALSITGLRRSSREEQKGKSHERRSLVGCRP